MTSAYEQGHIPVFQLRHRLQLARESAGLDRTQLAERMEVSRNSVLNAETGRTVPRKIVLNAWALACGVPVSWILTGQGSASPPDPSSGLGITSPAAVEHVALRAVGGPLPGPAILHERRIAS